MVHSKYYSTVKCKRLKGDLYEIGKTFFKEKLLCFSNQRELLKDNSKIKKEVLDDNIKYSYDLATFNNNKKFNISGMKRSSIHLKPIVI